MRTYDIRINEEQRALLVEALSRMPDKGIARNPEVALLEGMLCDLKDEEPLEGTITYPATLHDFTA